MPSLVNYKAALVTGAGSRLGRAMAMRLAERGIKVAVHYAHSKAGARETVEMIEARYGRNRAVALQADLLKDIETEKLVETASDRLDVPLDVLVNNASIFEYDKIGTITQESWERHIGSNLKAPLFLTQSFASQAPKALFDARDEPVAQAAIINMIDMRVRKLTPEFTTYTLAKSALWTLTQTAAQALAPDIRVNAIGPGPTLIGARQSQAHFDAQRRATVLKRGPNPEDITEALDYILSAQNLTGQLLCIDGGQHLGWETPDIQGFEG